MHLSAAQQATGEARLYIVHLFLLPLKVNIRTCRFTDDMPHIEGELYAGLVLSSHPHARFTVDASALDDMEVISGVFYYCDITLC